MKPYERRRTGDLAGTVGSTAPSFPIVLTAEATSQAVAGDLQPALSAPLPIPVGTAGDAAPAAPPAGPAAAPAPTGTSGVMSHSPVRAVPTWMRTAKQPVGLNGVFVDFQDVRWFAGGPTVAYTPARFTRIGEHRGFDVYQEGGRPDTIYLSLLDGAPELLTPYTRR
jgi:hypothetical protein